MRILYLGDVMGEMGLQTVEQVLPVLRKEKQADLVIAQAENLSEGRGITVKDFEQLQKAGVDFCTGGNWSLYRDEIFPVLDDPGQPIVRPANYPEGTPGRGWKYVEKNGKKVLVISLLGHVVGRDAEKPFDNPLHVIDKVLKAEEGVKRDATVINFHGDYSSEKVVIGHYLDGRATLVVGDHWHVPTADARVLPGGTAHITDVGMCGSLDSSLGVTYSSVIPRWYGEHPTRNVLETAGRKQFNAVLVTTAEDGLADTVEHIQTLLD